jgi:hypothetical protein
VAPSVGTKSLVSKLSEDLVTPFTREKVQVSRLMSVPEEVRVSVLKIIRDRVLKGRRESPQLLEAVKLAGKGWQSSGVESFQSRLQAALSDDVRDQWIER